MSASTIYTHAYHTDTIRDMHVLVSGGAGFIGSNIVSYLLQHGVGKVRVLDNLSNGFMRNLEAFRSDARFEFMEGDITRPDDCAKACQGMHLLTHQAALGSVPRSIKNPLATSDANTTGYLNMLIAANSTG